MNKKKLVVIAIAVAFLGATSCAQQICPAYAKVDKEVEKKEKRQGQF